MELDITGMTPEQKKKIRTIVSLKKAFGGNEEMGNYLMGELMKVYLPEEEEGDSKMDELASLYSITGDEQYSKMLSDQYNQKEGIDPAQMAQNEVLSTQFGEEFPIDSTNVGQNSAYQAFFGQNPEALSQYYDEAPEKKFKWGNIAAGTALGGPGGAIGELIKSLTNMSESKKEKEERIKSLQSQYKSKLPSN